MKVVISWLGSNKQLSLDAFRESGGDQRCTEGSKDMKMFLKSCSFKKYQLGENFSCIDTYPFHKNDGQSLVDGLHFWHGAIRKDFVQILEELLQSRSASNFLNLDTAIVRLKFLADVVTFYRYELMKLQSRCLHVYNF